MSAIEWTEAHKREALRRSVEIFALSVSGIVNGQNRTPLAAESLAFLNNGHMFAGGFSDVSTEKGWRKWLASVTGHNFTAARIEREVRRVDGLATGRLVREVWYCIRWRGSDDLFGRSQSRADAESSIMRERVRGARGCIVRVTRIRRAP